MEPSDFVLARSVEYFAVYPSGRKCSVTRTDVERLADWWAVEGVTIETQVKVENVPVFGPQVLV